MKPVIYSRNVGWHRNESSVSGLHQACVLEHTKFEALDQPDVDHIRNSKEQHLKF